MVRRCLLVALVLTGLLTACTAAPTWQQLTLPDGFTAATVAAASGEILVAGRGTAAPTVLRIGEDGAVSFRLDLTAPYAQEAEIFSISSSDDELYALGRAVGGAHANPRLSIWDGSLRTTSLVSREQEFFTFGGHDAGPLLGTLTPAGVPVIAGTRTTSSGQEGVLWTRSGTTWTKHTGLGAALASSASVSLGFTAAAASAKAIWFAGDDVSLSGGVRQYPAVRAGGLGRSWSALRLSFTAAGTGLNRATSLACLGDADSCWVAGWAGGKPQVWHVESDSAGRPVETSAVTLAGAAPASGVPTALVILAGTVPVVFTGASGNEIDLGCPAGWKTFSGPGAVISATTSGTQLYTVGADGLAWRTTLPTC